MNKKGVADGSSSFKGVCFSKHNKKYRARIKIDGQRRSLGCFKTEHEAAEAYNVAATEIFGKYAKLNII